MGLEVVYIGLIDQLWLVLIALEGVTSIENLRRVVHSPINETVIIIAREETRPDGERMRVVDARPAPHVSGHLLIIVAAAALLAHGPVELPGHEVAVALIHPLHLILHLVLDRRDHVRHHLFLLTVHLQLVEERPVAPTRVLNEAIEVQTLGAVSANNILDLSAQLSKLGSLDVGGADEVVGREALAEVLRTHSHLGDVFIALQGCHRQVPIDL